LRITSYVLISLLSFGPYMLPHQLTYWVPRSVRAYEPSVEIFVISNPFGNMSMGYLKEIFFTMQSDVAAPDIYENVSDEDPADFYDEVVLSMAPTNVATTTVATATTSSPSATTSSSSATASSPTVTPTRFPVTVSPSTSQPTISKDDISPMKTASNVGSWNVSTNKKDGFSAKRSDFESTWFQTTIYVGDRSSIQKYIQTTTELALEELEKMTCIPKYCAAKNYEKKLYSPQDNIPKILLVSFPGSGNTWIRHALESALGFYTGSFYNDKKLYKFQNMKGEMEPALSKTTSFVKTHFPLWQGNFVVGNLQHFKGAIQVVRSPFDSILSELNRQGSQQNHKGTASDEFLREKGQSRARGMAKSYHNLIKFWEGLNGYDFDKKSSFVHEGNGNRYLNVSLVRDMRSSFSLDYRAVNFGKGLLVLTLFYEDIQNNFVETLGYLLAFTKYFHRDLMPSVSEALMCALHATNEGAKRSSSKSYQFNPFTVQRDWFCDLFETTWNVNKWGSCNAEYQPRKPRLLMKTPSRICDI